jgi:MarR family transcriptional regulator, organic hydroperoxide resistance regulator
MPDRKKQITGIIENFRAVFKAMTRITPPLLSKLDITQTQMFILSLVKENEGLSLKELAAMLGISSSAATQQVNDLVERGYLNREINDADRRFVKISLSETMSNPIGVFEDSLIERFSDIFNEFSDEELEIYSNLNRKIASQIQQRQGVFPDKTSN